MLQNLNHLPHVKPKLTRKRKRKYDVSEKEKVVGIIIE